MDAKITKKRLGNMLSYDWIKIVALAVALILVWYLLFTMTATQLTTAQTFSVYSYIGTSANDLFDKYPSSLKNIFSYDIQSITSEDFNNGGNQAATVVQARFSVGEGDAMFVSTVRDEENGSYTAGEGEEAETVYYSYLESFLYGYYYSVETFGEGGYLDELNAYLDQYYLGDYKNPDPEVAQIDETLVKKDFRARLKKLNDKRYKKEAEIKKAEVQELARVESYRLALIEFEGYLEKGYISFQKTALNLQNSLGETETKEDYYSINLCPNEETMGSLKDAVFYQKTVTDETGTEKKVATAENMNLVLLDLSESKYRYSRWEGLKFVNYVVRTHCSELKA